MRQDGQLCTWPPDRSRKMLSCRTIFCACAAMPAAKGSPAGRAARALSILHSTAAVSCGSRVAAVSGAEADAGTSYPAH